MLKEGKEGEENGMEEGEGEEGKERRAKGREETIYVTI